MKKYALWFLEKFGDSFFIFSIVYAIITYLSNYYIVADDTGMSINLLFTTAFNIFLSFILWAFFHVLLDWYKTAKETNELLKKDNK